MPSNRMPFIKNPRKLFDKVAREFGGHKRTEGRLVSYAFDDGYSVRLSPTVTPSAAAAICQQIRDRYPSKQTTFHGRKVTHAPRVDIATLEATAHARERLSLMRAQAGVQYSELILALRAPHRVEFSTKHDSWIWVGERIAVCACESEGRLLITTLLWSRTELWDAFPRPGVAAGGAA